MKSITVVEAKAKFSTFLAEVEAGEEIAVTRHGKIIARLVPQPRRMAIEVFRPLWDDASDDLKAPADLPADDVASFDD